MALTLFIGNKNYSSWSMRPWMAMKGAGIAFEEVSIPLYTGPADKAKILSVTPSGKVPALVDGDITVWDSLAIIEYLAERFPQAGLWPQDRAARAHARSISAEMHSGFAPLRNECGMNIHRPVRAKPLSNDALDNVARGLNYVGKNHSDNMLVMRLPQEKIIFTVEVAAYMDGMQAYPAFREWTEAALAETLIIDRFETD